MRLNLLLDKLLIKQVEGETDIEISNLEIDSRNIQPGNLFICINGHAVDGHRFAFDAVTNGAIAVLTEKPIDVPDHVAKIRVPDTKRAMAILADYFYGQPTRKLKLIGVTGTNGKTTTTHFIEKILNDYGKKAGLIGTLHMRVGNYSEKTNNTTPESLELQRYFRKMLDDGAEYSVLEVSSHALDMGRVRKCNFKTAVFTNLTHDHLDYHQTIERYGEVKSLLFSQLGNIDRDDAKFAILNADDPMSESYAKKTSAQIVTYGIDQNADVRGKQIRMGPNGTSLVVETFVGNISLQLNTLGRFNVYNALAAVAACLAEQVPLDHIAKSLAHFEGVKGRFEAISAGQNFSVIIDFAHNPDGLENVLRTAKQFAKGRLICVFGCEGDKDKTKRPYMANAAAAYCELAVITSDNTRFEEPEAIIREIVDYFKMQNIPFNRYVPIVDRREAIGFAIENARPDDCVVIAGRGHETQLLVKNQAVPFHDKEVALEFIHNVFQMV